MADEFTKAPDPNVVDALNGVYRPILTFFEQAHRQEHRFKIRFRYGKLEKRFDKFVHCAREWRRCLLNRIERLGGEADSTMGPVIVADDIMPAYDATHDGLRSIHDAVNQAIAVVQSANDHPSHKLLMHLQHDVDRNMSKIEAWQRQTKDLGENYAITVI